MRDASEHSENDQDEDDEVQEAIQPDDEDEDADPNTPSIKIEHPPSATLSTFKPEVSKRQPKAAMSKSARESGSKQASRQGREALWKPFVKSVKEPKGSKNAPPPPSNGDVDDDQAEGMDEAEGEGDVDPDAEGDGDLEVEQDEDLDQDPDAELNEDPDVNEDAIEDGGEDGDVDGEVELQPADRQDALDAIAQLELKFALIRQRIYVDKMEELVKEEGWVRQGRLSTKRLMLN
jgi:hypothetical protein